MRFSIRFTPSADRDLDHFRAHQQRIVTAGIKRYLRDDADIESKKRKRLETNELAPWELKLGDFRVFYRIEKPDVVKIVAVGHKVHNDLYIRGSKVEL